MRSAITFLVFLPMLLLIGSENVERDSASKSSGVVGDEAESQSTKSACKGGCSAVAVKSDELRPEALRFWLKKYSNEEPAAATTALETLLFHGTQLENWLATNGSHSLDKEHLAFLQKELKRGREAQVSARIVDADGKLRMEFEQSVRVGEKQHLHVYKTSGIAAPIISFTVKRVGLHHLWARL
jgi:hypothetical protein